MTTLLQALPDHTPPHSIDAEQAVLGCALISKTAVDVVLTGLTREDFYFEAHRKIFDVMAYLWERESPIDTLSVPEELRKREQLERIGGVPYILTLNNSVPTSAHVDEYLRIVTEKATLRRVIAASQETQAECQRQEGEVVDLTERAQRRLEVAVERATSSEDVPTLRDELLEVAGEIARAAQGEYIPRGLSTGFARLDDAKVFLRQGDFIVAGGRPSMGKTADWLQISVYVAGHYGPVLFFSQEMSRKKLAGRVIAFQAPCNLADALDGKLVSREAEERCYRAAAEFSALPLHVDHRNGISVQDVRAGIRRVNRQQERKARQEGTAFVPVQLVVVDYLQLMRGLKGESGHELLTLVSRGLKGAARDFEVPVVGLSQLSRQVERREDKRPMMSDLRESGSIEAEADVILLYYRPRYYQREGKLDPYELERAETIIAKYRDGPVGTAHRTFLPAYAGFDLDELMDLRHAGMEPPAQQVVAYEEPGDNRPGYAR